MIESYFNEENKTSNVDENINYNSDSISNLKKISSDSNLYIIDEHF